MSFPCSLIVMEIFILALIPVSCLCFVSTTGQLSTGKYRKIALTQWPSELSIHFEISEKLLCAFACTTSNGALCRGFKIKDGECYLFRSTILHDGNKPEPFTSEETAYKLVSLHLPRCTNHPGFQVVLTSDGTYCFYGNSTVGDYWDARIDCNSRGAIVGYFDSLDKLIAGRAILSQNPVRDIYVGLYYDPGDGFFKGELGQVFNSVSANSLWRRFEPSWPEGTPCVMATRQNEYNDIPCNVKGFYHVCEIVDIF